MYIVLKTGKLPKTPGLLHLGNPTLSKPEAADLLTACGSCPAGAEIVDSGQYRQTEP